MTHVEEKWTPNSQIWLHQLRAIPVIAVIRSPDPQMMGYLAQVAIQSGLRFIEIAPSARLGEEAALDLIQHLRHHYPQQQIGAGTVLTVAQAARVIEAGAQFVVSPCLDMEIVQHCRHQEIPVIPGVLTPSEIWQAWQAGATAIKIFPIESVGGARYLRHLSQPLGALPLIPTGGVTLANAQAFLQAGALGVGVGGDLFPPDRVQLGDWQGIEARIRQFVISLRSSTPS